MFTDAASANVAAVMGVFQIVEVYVPRQPSTFRVYNGRRVVGDKFPDLFAARSFAAMQMHTAAGLESFTNHRLAKCIERRDEAKVKAVSRVYDLAEHGNERWSDIVERLGHDHPMVAAARDASELSAIARQEARRRLGPVQDVCFVAYLRSNKSRRS